MATKDNAKPVRGSAPVDEAFPERRGMKNPKGFVLAAKAKFPGNRILHGYRWVCLSCSQESAIYQSPDTIRVIEQEHICWETRDRG